MSTLQNQSGYIEDANPLSVKTTETALPTGAASSAKQDTQITAEQAIQTAVEGVLSVKSIDDVYEATLSLDTNAYADGDVLADTQSLEANAFPANGGKLLVQSIQVIDLDDQKGALDIVLLRSNTSLGTENSAPNIVDGNADEILCVKRIYSTDYKDIGGVSWASIDVSEVIKAASDATALFVAAISRDTKTYTASGLIVRVGVLGRSA